MRSPVASALWTGGRLGVRMFADDVARALDRTVRPRVVVVNLTGDEYLAALGEARARGVRGGTIHDYLHLVAGRKAGAKRLYTGNVSDFQSFHPARRSGNRSFVNASPRMRPRRESSLSSCWQREGFRHQAKETSTSPVAKLRSRAASPHFFPWDRERDCRFTKKWRCSAAVRGSATGMSPLRGPSRPASVFYNSGIWRKALRLRRISRCHGQPDDRGRRLSASRAALGRAPATCPARPVFHGASSAYSTGHESSAEAAHPMQCRR